MAEDRPDRCSRCGRERPVTGGAGEGWTVFEDEEGNVKGQVCPGCHTRDEQVAGVPDYPPEASEEAS